MKDNIVLSKSYVFFLQIIEAYKVLAFEMKEYVLSRQLLKCGTSIGANLEESEGGQTGKDFFSKICVAYKEARETHYWIRLIRDSRFLDEKRCTKLLSDCEEILRILTAIQKTLKKKQNRD